MVGLAPPRPAGAHCPTNSLVAAAASRAARSSSPSSPSSARPVRPPRRRRAPGARRATGPSAAGPPAAALLPPRCDLGAAADSPALHLCAAALLLRRARRPPRLPGPGRRRWRPRAGCDQGRSTVPCRHSSCACPRSGPCEGRSARSRPGWRRERAAPRAPSRRRCGGHAGRPPSLLRLPPGLGGLPRLPPLPGEHRLVVRQAQRLSQLRRGPRGNTVVSQDRARQLFTQQHRSVCS